MSPTSAAAGGVEIPSALSEHVYRGPWWKHGGIRSINLLLIVALITSSTNGYDGSMMNGLQSLTNWQNKFNHPEGSTKGLLNAIQNIGALIGLPFCAYVTDRFGRRFGILFGSIIMLAGVAMQSTSNTIGVFIASRGIIGFGLTFAQNAAPILITELAYPTQRAQLTSLFNSLWYSGSIIAAWTTFGTFRIGNSMAWRIPSILQAIPSVIQVALIWFVPESPRWLISKGRTEEARRILARYHTEDSNESDPLVEFEMAEIQTGLELEKRNSTSWKSLVSTPGNRRRLRIVLGIAFFSQWSGNGLVSYYLNDVLNQIGITSQFVQTLYNGILQIFNLAVAVLAAFLCDKFGRRRLFLASNVGMLVAFVFWTLCEGLYAHDTSNNSAGRAILAFIFVFYFAYDIAYSPLLVAYTVEITPYEIRAKVLSIMNLAVSASLVFNQYVNPIALGSLKWKYYIVYCCWLAFELVFIYFFMLETKGLSLEESSVLYDGASAVQQVAEVHAQGAGSDGGSGHGEKYEVSKGHEKFGGGIELEHVERI